MPLQKLAEFEQSHVYVFHGSGLRLSCLEPRQAFTEIAGQKVADGQPSVFASDFIHYAIFMAIINAENCPGGLRASCSYENGSLVFAATSSTMAQIDESTTGYVHVLNRCDFVQRNHTEWVSYKAVEPLNIIKVTRQDFDREISIIECPSR